MTPDEREQLHDVLFGRLLREVDSGSLKDAQIALLMLEDGTAADFLEAFIPGDD